MESNHRRLGVGQESLPLDHGTVWQMDSPGVAPESSACGADVFLLDDEPMDLHQAEAVGLEPTSVARPPPVFKTGSSSSRMTSVCDSFQVPGVGIEPTASWFRARRHYQQQLPRNELGEMDSNHHYLVQSQAACR
jgi:hypothetical protein